MKQIQNVRSQVMHITHVIKKIDEADGKNKKATKISGFC